jgi:preprotein translocase subunit SecD
VTWPFVYLASTRSTFAKPWANGMGRMETLQAAAAHQRRLDQKAERESGQSGDRGVSATINGPGGATATLPRSARPVTGSDRPTTDEEEGR